MKKEGTSHDKWYDGIFSTEIVPFTIISEQTKNCQESRFSVGGRGQEWKEKIMDKKNVWPTLCWFCTPTEGKKLMSMMLQRINFVASYLSQPCDWHFHKHTDIIRSVYKCHPGYPINIFRYPFPSSAAFVVKAEE